MLYALDDEERRQAAIDNSSLEDFVAWLEKQPADEAYKYTSHNCCLVQYMETKGYVFGEGMYGRFAIKLFGDIWQNEGVVLVTKPQTFGGALDRAKTLLNKQGE